MSQGNRTDHAARRARQDRWRTLGVWLVVLGAAAALWAVFVVVVGWQLFGGRPLSVQCGSWIDPIAYPPGAVADACAGVLAEQGGLTTVFAVLALALLAAGITILVRVPAPLSF